MFYFFVSLGMTLNDKLNEVPSNMINTFTRAKNVLKNIHYTHLKKLILKSFENIVPALNLDFLLNMSENLISKLNFLENLMKVII